MIKEYKIMECTSGMMSSINKNVMKLKLGEIKYIPMGNGSSTVIFSQVYDSLFLVIEDTALGERAKEVIQMMTEQGVDVMEYIELDLDYWIGVKDYHKGEPITIYHHKNAF
jgi:hypothetical protein